MHVGGATIAVEIQEIESGGEDASGAIKTTTRALFWERDSADPVWVDTPVYQREKLLAGNTFTGPAIVEQFDSTTIIGIGQQATIDKVGHIIIERASA